MNKAQRKLIISTDGGSRGNPGPAGIGVYIEDEKGKEVAGIGERIGTATNNVAEYMAIIKALSWLCQNKDQIDEQMEIRIQVDSQLAYSQIVGLYKIKNETIRNLIFIVRQKEAELGIAVKYSQIPREKNKKADALVNLALDNKI